MPELPDIEAYLAALRLRLTGATLQRISIADPFVLRSVDPQPDAAEGRRIVDLHRLGKRIVMALDGELFIVIHLMIAGRLQWIDDNAGKRAPRGIASFHFSSGTLVLTEAGTKRRASIHLVAGEPGLGAHHRDGLELPGSDLESFLAAIRSQRRTVKRALTDPDSFSGIGNAYSDEILHRAMLSPLAMTTRLSDEEIVRLHEASESVLREWTERLVSEARKRWPRKVTAFRPQFAAHGKFGKPCPVCGTKIERIVRSDNEINYCPRCQTNGKILKDRSLSRLLRDDWPKRSTDL